MDDGVVGIAGGVEHLHARPAFRHLVGELAPAHAAGHDDVGEQEIERLAGLDQLQRGAAVGGGDRLVAEALELRGDEIAHQRVVLDDEDGLGRRPWLAARRGLLPRPCPRAGGR